MTTVVTAQTSFQTLPQGFNSTPGSTATAFPANTAADQVFQWHYDAAEFDATGPIRITDISIRGKPSFIIGPFNFQEWNVTLAEAATDIGADHESIFARNIIRSKTCRTGPWLSPALLPLPGSTVGGNVWMGLTESFVYDPSTGNDFIVQIQKCGTQLAWSTSMDMSSGAGGSRFGNTSNCRASAEDFRQESNAPIVGVRYESASQTLPHGFDSIEGNGSVGWPVTTTVDQKWQWQYSFREFDECGPIAITEIYVRPDNSSSLASFQFQQFDVTLATSTTLYSILDHAIEFGRNVHEQELVHSGQWAGGPVPSGGSGVSDWVPIGLDKSFRFDASLSRDLIVQIEKCGASQTWTSTMDGRLGTGPNTVGGNRYGHTTNCQARFHTQASANEFVPIIRIDYQPLPQSDGAIDSFPWREDFDDLRFGEAPRGWHNLEGEALSNFGDWIFTTLPTMSVDTGPNGDHTTGGGTFAYVEDSQTDNALVGLMTPTLDLTSLTNPRLSFWVHSRSATDVTQSTLSVDVFRVSTGRFVEDRAIVGHSGNMWTERTVNLTAFAGESIQILFRVDNDNGSFLHDIAIDDVRVYQPTNQAGQVPTVFASLDVSNALEPNGLPVSPGLPGPYFKQLDFGEVASFRVEGQPLQPFAILLGPLNVGAGTLPGIGQLDIGLNNLTTLISGFNTNFGGEWTLDVPWTIPSGLSLPLQAAVLTGGPSQVALSNAVVLEAL